MAKTPDVFLKDYIGTQAMQIASLLAEIDRLKEELAALKALSG